jgi:soluble lytic murein transglycosylase
MSCTWTEGILSLKPTETPEVILPTSTPTPLPTPTITPSPEPGVRIEEGEQALAYGQWDDAINIFAQAYETNSDSEIKSAALLGLGRAFAANDQLDQAKEILKSAILDYQDSPHKADLYFTYAMVLEENSEYEEAILFYQQYLSIRPNVIDSYTYENIADLYFETGQYNLAIQNYISAKQAPRLEDTLDIDVKIGRTYWFNHDLDTALIVFQDVMARTENDHVKAQMLNYIGEIYIQLDKSEAGYQSYLTAVENYPTSYDSYFALVKLVENDIEVDEFSRGIVNYFAGQNFPALEAFNRYLEQNPDEHEGDVHWYKAQIFTSLGDPYSAISEFKLIINEYPDSDRVADAYDLMVDIYWLQLEDYKSAIRLYEEYIDLYPFDSNCPQFLFYAGRIAERFDDLFRAAKLWERLGQEYPVSDLAFDGFFQSGIAFYRLKNYRQAMDMFSNSVFVDNGPEDESQAYFWIAKTYEAQGLEEQAQQAYQTAMGLDPTGYYSERAADVLAGVDFFEAPDLVNTDINYTAERAEAQAWIRFVFTVSDDVDFDDLTPLLVDDRFVRGAEFWSLGLSEEALIEFDSLQRAVSDDAVRSYILGKYLIDNRIYRQGIFAIRRVLDLAGLDDAGTISSAPIYFNRLRFGLYFPELVFPAAEDTIFHPLYIYSVIRQESLFESSITSSAAAKGLMQMTKIAWQEVNNKGVLDENYEEGDLYRPEINILYGTNFLSISRYTFGGKVYALASYHAGPGATFIWSELAKGDKDLFIEVTRFEDTRNYIRWIYEQFAIYRDLYTDFPQDN